MKDTVGYALSEILLPVYMALKTFVFKVRFRTRNRHNNVTAASIFPLDSVSVGNNSYGPLKTIWMAPSWARIEIGHYCSIGPDVTFLVGGSHDYRRISTYPFQSLVYKKATTRVGSDGRKRNLDIIIEDDVWIGHGALILSGARIGKGSVIGARSIVTKDVPPYSVFIGNKVHGKRFPDDIIEKVKDIDFSKVRHSGDDAYGNFCTQQVDEENVDRIMEAFTLNTQHTL